MDAYVTVRYRCNNLCSREYADENGGFEAVVRKLIEDECGVTAICLDAGEVIDISEIRDGS